MGTKLNYLLPFILILTGSLLAQVDPGTSNLKHHWSFDDGTTNDAIGGVNGTLEGGATIVDGDLVTRAQEQFMSMDGFKIMLADYNECSLVAWFTSVAGANTGYSMLAFFGDSNPQGFGSNSFFLQPARGDDKSRTAISIGVETNPWTAESGADGPELDDGLMHHMVGTIDSANITLYIDGVLAIAPAGKTQGPTLLSATNGLWGVSPNCAWLCKSGYTGDPEWIGNVHDFRIYDKALTEDEVLWLYENTEPTGVKENIAEPPREFSLSQNYPNPFNPITTISFNLPKRSKVNIAVYDLFGREVALVLNEVKAAGQYSVQFDGTNMSSGIYLCRMEIDGSQILTRKMTLMK